MELFSNFLDGLECVSVMKNLLGNKIILIAVAGVLVAGCSRDSETSPPVAPAEVKGEPIQKLAVAEPVAEAISETPDSLPIADPDLTIVEEETPAVDVAAAAEEVVGIAVEAEPGEAGASEFIQSGGRDYLSVGFDHLASYEFEVTDDLLEAEGDPAAIAEKTNSMIPDTVRKLNASSVAVKGYMLPLKVEEGQVTEFLLMRDQSMCCFGTVPKINEWVSVKTIGAGVKPIMDEPVTIFGKLHVGEIRENGYLVGIYRMDGEKLAGPLDL